MKRWADWERGRRYTAQSRDLSYLDMPRRSDSNRGSFVSSSDTFASGFGQDAYASRRVSGLGPPLPHQIELPAPLASAPASIQSDSYDHSTLRDPPTSSSEESQARGSSTTRSARPVISSNPSYDMHPQYRNATGDEYYDSDDVERDPILQHGSPNLDSSPIMDSASFASPLITPTHDVLPPPPPLVDSTTTEVQSTNPFTRMMQSSPQGAQQPKRRGVSLVDDGPVPGTDGFRPVQRTTRRQSSQNVAGAAGAAASPTAGLPASNSNRGRQSGAFSPVESSYMPPTSSLPPGAAPPRHH